MTRKVIVREFVVPSVLAIGLCIVLSVSAVHLAKRYLGPQDAAQMHRFIADH
jgi:hypothetical protein